MEDKIKVSVIVPIFNAAPYLHECMDSILAQTLEDIEVICVDDGSTDDSPSIIKGYSAKDSRVIVLSQQNQYAGVARNHGMEIAKGKYLVFWDADDFFEPSALEKMYYRCEEDQADICVCGGDRLYEEIGLRVATSAYLKKGRIPETVPFNRETNSEFIMTFTTIMVWNKMYKRSFVESHNLEFQSRRNGNDVYFSACALCLANRITVIHEHLVCYRIGRAGSLVSSLDVSPTSPLEAWCDAREFLCSLPYFPACSFDNKVVGVIRHSFRNVKTWNGYVQLYDFLLSGGLGKLGVEEHPKGYYVDWADDFLRRLLHSSREDFLVYLTHLGYQKLDEANAKRVSESRKLKNEIKQIRSSKSFRMGRFLAEPVRMFKKRLQR